MRCVVRGSLRAAVLRDGPAEMGAVSRITRQTETVRQVAAGLLMVLRTVVFGVVAALVGLATIALPVALVAVPSLALATILLVRVSRVWRGRYQHALVAEERLAEHAERIVTGLRDVLACAAANRAQADIDRDLRAYAAATERVATIGACRIGVFGVAAFGHVRFAGRQPLRDSDAKGHLPLRTALPAGARQPGPRHCPW